MRSYDGAGSEYTVVLNSDGTFALAHLPTVGASADQTLTGTYQSLPSGFLAMTGTAGTGVTIPDGGVQAFAIEIPGSVLFLKPLSSSGQNNIIPMIPAGVCPTSVLSENWIKMKVRAGWDDTDIDTSGAFSFNPDGGTAMVLTQYSLADPTDDLLSQPEVLGTGACAEGTLIVAPGTSNESDLFLTAAGGAIVHTNPSAEADAGDEIIFAIPPATSAIDPGALAGTYSGLVFSSGANSSFPVELTLTATTDGGGVFGYGTPLIDVTTGALSDGGAAVLALSTAGIANGLVTGTITTPGGGGGAGLIAQPLTCEVQLDANGSGRTVMACAGEGQSNDFFSIALAGR